MRVANAPQAERRLEGHAPRPARHRHVKRPRPLTTQKYASLTHRQEQSGRADPTIASRQSCHSDPSVASSCAPSPCTRIGSSHQARSDAPERTTRAANRDAHATSPRHISLKTEDGCWRSYGVRGPEVTVRCAGTDRDVCGKICFANCPAFRSHRASSRCQGAGSLMSHHAAPSG